ncbi:MAG: oligosaccharide flippase family protein, partial [bacterium]|nr:oligosaccharide flippase family protein [bacterium]
MTSARSLASNFSIQLFGKGLSVLVGLASVAILTRVLGATAFGEYTTATTFLQMFGVVVDFGLTLTMIVMISESGVDEERMVGNFFGLRLISGFILFSLAPLTVLALPWGPVVQQAVFVGALAYFLMGGATML